MDQENDLGYYKRREAISRELAAGATDATIKRIHTQFANTYAAKVIEAIDKPRLKIVS